MLGVGLVALVLTVSPVMPPKFGAAGSQRVMGEGGVHKVNRDSVLVPMLSLICKMPREYPD